MSERYCTYQRIAQAVDPDGSALTLWPVEDAVSVQIAGLCSTAGATTTVRLFAFSSPRNLSGIMPALSFTSAMTADYAGSFSGTPNENPQFLLTGVQYLGLKVDAVTAGAVWTLIATTTYSVPSRYENRPYGH